MSRTLGCTTLRSELATPTDRRIRYNTVRGLGRGGPRAGLVFYASEGKRVFLKVCAGITLSAGTLEQAPTSRILGAQEHEPHWVARTLRSDRTVYPPFRGFDV